MIIGLIPARSGSKRIPNKNIKLLGGFPLMVWSIAASKMSNLKGTFLSTDSKEYADIGIKFGADWIMRQNGISDDDSGDYGYLKEAFDITKVDMIAILRPTIPLRDPKIIDKAIDLINGTILTGLRSAYELSEPPYKNYKIKMGFWEPYSTGYYGKGYHRNGYIDIVKRDVIESLTSDTSEQALYGSMNWPFETNNVGEIDTEEDLDYVEWRLQKYGSPIYEYLRNFRKIRT